MEMESLPVSQLKSVEQEGLQQVEKAAGRNKGGWITLPFIAGSVLGLGLATDATTTNLVVYLLKKYNVESINATQIANVVRGTLNLVPVAAAVVSDSYSGCFPVVIAGTVINVLSFVLFTLSAALPSLRPPHCAAPSPSPACDHHASAGQLAVLYTAVCLLVIGGGAPRFTVATLGADQFASARDQDAFFSWFFVSLYTSFLLGDTAIVYLQDSVSWALGFGICLAATVASLGMLLLGARYYRMPAPKGSPYNGLLRVVVAAVRKARLDVGATGTVRYYLGDGAVAASASDRAPSNRLRFLNRAAIITASDGGHSQWRVCTVQQVEDLKALLAVLPVCSSGILVSASIGVKLGMVILQALSMDRSLGPRFKIPAGSIPVCALVAFIAATPVLERAVFPLWRRLTGALPTPLQRIGLGHVLNICAMVAAALVERRRLSTLKMSAHHGAGEAAPAMSVLWLLIPLGIMGVGEALHFPGYSAFYYQEFPKTFRTMATAMAPLTFALGFYVCTGIVDVVRRVTAWLPANINQGRIDNLYWTVAVMGAINFGYFLLCACRYKNRRN